MNVCLFIELCLPSVCLCARKQIFFGLWGVFSTSLQRLCADLCIWFTKILRFFSSWIFFEDVAFIATYLSAVSLEEIPERFHEVQQMSLRQTSYRSNRCKLKFTTWALQQHGRCTLLQSISSPCSPSLRSHYKATSPVNPTPYGLRAWAQKVHLS